MPVFDPTLLYRDIARDLYLTFGPQAADIAATARAKESDLESAAIWEGICAALNGLAAMPVGTAAVH